MSEDRPEELGDCFIVAARLVRQIDGAQLVHGFVEPPDGSVPRHWHAWVEVEQTFDHPGLARPITVRTAIDKSNGHDQELPVELYHKLGQVDVRARYSADEALALMHEHDHYGPWVTE